MAMFKSVRKSSCTKGKWMLSAAYLSIILQELAQIVSSTNKEVNSNTPDLDSGSERSGVFGEGGAPVPADFSR